MRQKDILHVTNDCINNLFFNTLTLNRKEHKNIYVPISLKRFKKELKKALKTIKIPE